MSDGGESFSFRTVEDWRRITDSSVDFAAIDCNALTTAANNLLEMAQGLEKSLNYPYPSTDRMGAWRLYGAKENIQQTRELAPFLEAAGLSVAIYSQCAKGSKPEVAQSLYALGFKLSGIKARLNRAVEATIHIHGSGSIFRTEFGEPRESSGLYAYGCNRPLDRERNVGFCQYQCGL